MATYKITCSSSRGEETVETGCSREQIDQRMRAHAINKFNEDHNYYYNAIEAVNWVIEEEAGNEGITPKEWKAEHADEVEQLIKDNINWEGEGLYTNEAPCQCVYKFGSNSFEDDGYTFSIEEESENEDYYIVSEDEDNWYVDMHVGEGVSTYPKKYYTKEAAMAHQKGLC